MSFLDTLQTKLSAALADLTSLEVRTYRGDITTVVDTAGDGALRMKEWLAQQATGNLKLVRLTRSEFDGDTVLVVDDGTTEAGPVPQQITAAHEAAVQSAHEMRRGLAELAVRAVKAVL